MLSPVTQIGRVAIIVKERELGVPKYSQPLMSLVVDKEHILMIKIRACSLN